MPDADRWRRLRDLFDAAVAIAPDQRRTFLTDRCAGDTALREEVEALLASDERAAPFLRDATQTPATGNIESDAVAPGQRIGTYRLVRRLAAGGMGAVWLAERDDGQFRQQVAVKLIRRGMDTDEMLTRFRQERQLLANLRHPNISCLLDGGLTPDGRPYVVMEYVDGLPIDQFCDQRRLTIRDRVELFRKICAPVQFAHQNLVVHRDLKPGNILINEAGSPVLLDFGIAKVLDPNQPADSSSDLTLAGQRPMTPRYASPEQIKGEPVSTAADVYALGVVLYELLTSRCPYRVQGASLRDLEHAVCEQEPEAPSAAVGRTARSSLDTPDLTLDSIATARNTDPPRLRRALAGDLDRIVLSALRKEPQRRYASADQLSEDLRRYLAGLPVSAQPDTVRYRTAKFVRRNQLLVVFAATLFLAVSALAISMTIQSRRVAHQRNLALAAQADAQEQTALAQSEAAKARQMNTFLEGMLTAADPERPEGQDLTVRQVLARAAKTVDTDLAGQDELAAEAHYFIGRTYRTLGNFDEAEPHLQTALELRRKARPADPRQLATSLAELATLEQSRGDYPAAVRLFREALGVEQSHAGTRAADEAAMALKNNLALALQDAGDHATAESLFLEVLTWRRSHFGPESLEVANSAHNLACLYLELDRGADAEPLFREALKIHRAKLGDRHAIVANTLNNLGNTLRQEGRYDAAEPLLLQSLALRRELLGNRHPDVILSLMSLATLRDKQGRGAESEPLLTEALTISRATLGPQHPRTTEVLYSLGILCTGFDRYADAESWLTQALELQLNVLGKTHLRTAYTQAALADVLRLLDRPAEAVPLYAAADEVMRKSLDPGNPRRMSLLLAWGYSLMLLERLDDAEPVLRECISRVAPADPLRIRAQSVLGGVLTGAKRYADAEPVLLDAVRSAESSDGGSAATTQAITRRLVTLYEAWGQRDKAAAFRAKLNRESPAADSAPATRRSD